MTAAYYSMSVGYYSMSVKVGFAKVSTTRCLQVAQTLNNIIIFFCQSIGTVSCE